MKDESNAFLTSISSKEVSKIVHPSSLLIHPSPYGSQADYERHDKNAD